MSLDVLGELNRADFILLWIGSDASACQGRELVGDLEGAIVGLVKLLSVHQRRGTGPISAGPLLADQRPGDVRSDRQVRQGDLQMGCFYDL